MSLANPKLKMKRKNEPTTWNAKITILSTITILLIMGLQVNASYNFSSGNTSENTPQIPPLSGESIIENRTTFSDQLVIDPGFSFIPSNSPWTDSKKGDLQDTNGGINAGEANFQVIGDQKNFSYTAPVLNGSDWIPQLNPEFPAFPEWPYGSGNPSYGIDEFGLWANHSWRETAIQTPSVQWVRNFSLSEDLSDYTITSTQVSATLNASADINIDVPGDNPLQYVTYDYVKFYIRVSDLAQTTQYTIASYKTTNLGRDSPLNTTLLDTFMESVSETNIIFYLSQVLGVDSHNFTVILGMDIKCEDNEATDYDYWNMLRIKSFSLNFTYEKKIDQDSGFSWSQTGRMINSSLYPGDEILINNATIDFSYYIDHLWPATSPNSEIRIHLNGYLHTEVLKLTNISTSSQQIALGDGFDVSSLMTSTDENITLEIELYLADSFELAENLTLFIDNVFLNVSYTVIHQDSPIETELVPVDSYSINIPWNTPYNLSLKYREKISGMGISGSQFQIQWLGATNNTNLLDMGNGNYTLSLYTNETQANQNYYLNIVVLGENLYLSQNLIIEIQIIGRPILFDVKLNGMIQDSSPTISLIYGDQLNISTSYRDTITNESISGGTGTLLGSGLLAEEYDFISNPMTYDFILNSSDLGIGVHSLSVYLEKENYAIGYAKIRIEVSSRDNYLHLFLNGKNSTITSQISLPIQERLNITFELFDQSTKLHLIADDFSLNGLGEASYNSSMKEWQHEILIETAPLSLGVHYLTLYIERANYQFISQVIEVELTPREGIMSLQMNKEAINASTSQEWDFPITKTLNITVSLQDGMNSSVLDGVTFSLFGISAEHYSSVLSHKEMSFYINSTSLGLGIYSVSLVAEKFQYSDVILTQRIIIRPIRTAISTLASNNSVTISPNSILSLNVSVFNEDDNISVENCVVSYSWDYGQGEMQEISPGFYQVEISKETTRNIPEGVYYIFITVYNGPNYQFEQFVMTINIIDIQNDGLPQWVFYVFVTSMVGLVAYIIAYQKYLKYPKVIRKLHKVKRGIEHDKNINAEFLTRSDMFQTAYINHVTPILNLKESQVQKTIANASEAAKQGQKDSRKARFMSSQDIKGPSAKTPVTEKNAPADEVLTRIINSPSTDPQVLEELLKTDQFAKIKAMEKPKPKDLPKK